MTHDEVIDLLRKRIEEAGSQVKFARLSGISAAYITDVLYGRRDPGRSILKALGLRKVVTYEPLEAPPPPVYCDCGQPATERMRLKVNRRMEEFSLCARCAALEVKK